MPVLPQPLNQAILGIQSNLNPANNSVLDPWYTRWARTLGNLIGAGDPTTQVMLTPEMTTFLGKTGLPDVAAREAATTRAMGQLQQTLGKLKVDPATVDRTLAVAAKYPRVMAHNASIYSPGPIERLLYNIGPDVSGENFAASVPGRSEIIVTKASQNPPETFLHELTHTAQRIAQKGTGDDVYAQMAQQFGYGDNPLEVSARQAAARRMPQIDPNYQLVQAILNPPR